MNRPFNDQAVTDPQLPVNLVRKLGGWSTQAQSYPVFSPTWFRYRALAMLVPMAVFALILVGVGFLSNVIADEQLEMTPLMFNIGLAVEWGAYAILVFGGRWSASLVYRRHWSQRKEAIGIVTAIVLGILLATAIHEGDDYYGEKLKAEQRAAHQQEEAVAALPVPSFTSAEKSASSANHRPDAQAKKIKDDAARFLGRAIWLVMATWLGGSFDLLAYFRQRRALHDALRQQELDEARSRRNEAEMRLSVLAAQIEPHFLFNTLAGVRSAIRSDPARGIAIIDHLVDYLRATIPQMRSDANAATTQLDSQLNAARAYLGVMHARLPRLSYSVDCTPDLLTLPVPPLMLISLVENAVKHGIEPKPGAARIDVLARKISDAEGQYIELSVTDDGVGFSGVTSGNGIGLANIHERLTQLYGKRAHLNLKGRPQGGVVASITLPIEAASA
jgi:hypothetical protein